MFGYLENAESYTCSCQCILIQVHVTFFSLFQARFNSSKGSPTHSIPSAAIAAANRELQEMTADSANMPSQERNHKRTLQFVVKIFLLKFLKM